LAPVIAQGQGVAQGFDGCLLDPETKPQGRAKWSFNKFLTLNSPRLASSSLGLRESFSPKQATHLGEFPLHQMAFSINSHVGEEEKRFRA